MNTSVIELLNNQGYNNNHILLVNTLIKVLDENEFRNHLCNEMDTFILNDIYKLLYPMYPMPETSMDFITDKAWYIAACEWVNNDGEDIELKLYNAKQLIVMNRMSEDGLTLSPSIDSRTMSNIFRIHNNYGDATPRYMYSDNISNEIVTATMVALDRGADLTQLGQDLPTIQDIRRLTYNDTIPTELMEDEDVTDEMLNYYITIKEGYDMDISEYILDGYDKEEIHELLIAIKFNIKVMGVMPGLGDDMIRGMVHTAMMRHKKQ